MPICVPSLAHHQPSQKLLSAVSKAEIDIQDVTVSYVGFHNLRN
jgi:hypothetical protein